MAKLFISYVRDDTEAETNALYQTLRSEFGEATIYKDVDNVPIGANWKESVRTAIEDSTAFLWVVGPAWTPSGGRPATHQLDRVGDISAFEAWTASSPTGPID
jgi:hypothetical protein